MDMKEIEELMEFLEAKGLKKIFIKDGEKEILLEKEGKTNSYPHHIVPAVLEPNQQQVLNPKDKVENDNKTYIESPMVGTYYSSPSPDQPPFVKIGDRIEKDSVVCIIEAMKVMNEVKADVTGIVKEILIENGNPVEYGSKLFVIE